MIKKIVFSFTIFILKKAIRLRIKENPLHDENLELLFYSSKVTKILRKPLRELTPEEKEEWIKRIEEYSADK